MYELKESKASDEMKSALADIVAFKAAEYQRQFIVGGGKVIEEPHWELADFMGRLVHFREMQRGLESVFYESSAESSEFSDGWLTMCETGKALDSIILQLGSVLEHYTLLMVDLNNSQEKLDVVIKTADALVEQRCDEVPEFKDFLDEVNTRAGFSDESAP